MRTLQRYLQNQILSDALSANRIAFINGPRQVGKTTMAESLLTEINQHENYFTWDDDEFRKLWLKGPKDFVKSFKKNSVLVFDEIHKDRKWKSRLKGLYDLFKNDIRFIVTGSARLDFYRKTGDSLQGRYIPYRMHPLTVGESTFVKPPPEVYWDENKSDNFSFEELLQFGGFPEPFFMQNSDKVRRWQRLYRERMIKQDLRDLQEVRDVTLIESLALMLPERVGSQLSYQSLQEDLSTSFDSVKRWIDLLEALYFCYRIKPYSKNLKNSLRKEPKLFLYDWSLVTNSGARFENMVAGHLLKSCHAWTDCAMGEFELYYIRDKQKREVDFFITKNDKAFALIEVKSGQSVPTNSLLHYQKILKPQFCIQVVKDQKSERPTLLEHPGVQIMSARRFLSSLV
ncbi:MAG: ATP-binding protein [Bdellovibrionota bacterium]